MWLNMRSQLNTSTVGRYIRGHEEGEGLNSMRRLVSVSFLKEQFNVFGRKSRKILDASLTFSLTYSNPKVNKFQTDTANITEYYIIKN